MNNHDGTFREEGLMRGVALSEDGMEQAGMGVGVGDYDLDGHLDLVKTHFTGDTCGLYRNDGKGNFDDVTAAQDRRRDAFISWGAGLWISTTTDIRTFSLSPAAFILKSSASFQNIPTKRRASVSQSWQRRL